MVNSDIRNQAYGFFVEEASELLQVIENGLMSLSQEKSNSTVHEIMRAAHSIKGGAASVGLDTIKTISHRLEDFFKALYQDDVVIDRELEDLLLKGFDCLRDPLMEQIETGYFDSEAAWQRAEPVLKALEAKLGDALNQSQEYIPSSADLGIDLTSSLFEVDVATELERLESVLKEPSKYEVAGELKATAEVLAGFAEMLGLPGFGSIASTAMDALSSHPEAVLEITALALRDFRAAREQVLAGDRTSGGNPSAELLAYSKETPVSSAQPQNTEEDDFALQAYGFFIEEAGELLQVIDAGLSSLEREKSKQTIHEIMRAAHSIKGGAASVKLEEIRSLAYSLEKFFKALFPDYVEIDGELIALLRAAFECLRQPLLAQIEKGGFDKEAALSASQTIFPRLEEILHQSLNAPEEYIPSSEELGVDIVASIFEVDVLSELERLSQSIESENVAQQLTESAQVLANFAQMLGLPGFESIATAVLAALEKQPENAPIIAQLALADFHKAREQVLAGDRTLGGNPSPELLAFGAPSQDILSLTTPSLESVFGQTEQLEHPPLEAVFGESQQLETPSLEAVFGESQQLETPSLESVFGESEQLEHPPLESVFGESEQLEHPPLESVFGQSDELEAPSLESVFGKIQPLENPPLESVFGQQVEEQKLLNWQTDSPANLEEAVAQIEKAFDKLPAIENKENLLEKIAKKPVSAPSEKQDKLPKKRTSTAKNTPVGTALSVRVDFNRLERMNNLVGELAINRNSLSLQNENLQGSVKELLNRFNRFQLLTDKLRSLSDLMLVDASRPGIGQREITTEVQQELQPETRSEFDTLEMDRYGSLYALSQRMLEEIMQLSEAMDDIVLFARGSNQSLEQQRQMLTSLRSELMWARMLPLGEVLNRFPRVLRDLSSSYDKPVRLKLLGTGVLVDRLALEKLYDPLLHLLRNAFDHGIEDRETRIKQGKPEEGTIEVRAYHQGNQTIIEVKDDGNGLNLERIKAKAISVGLATPEQLAVMSNDRLADLIFEPGFSTAAQVSELSGRGVGLDVVRSQIQALKGTVTVSFVKGEGTTFSLRLPLTLTIAKLLVFLVHTNQGTMTALALPSDSVEEIVVPTPEQIKRQGQQRFLYADSDIIPIYNVGELLEYRTTVSETVISKALELVPTPTDWGLPLLLLRRGQQLFALEVNRLVTEQELVIKPFGACVAPPSYTLGCTILGDGTLIPVINGVSLLEQYIEPETSKIREEFIPTESPTTIAPTKQADTILVVDDSAALRRTLALTLEKSGYRVLQARDGREALSQLQQQQGINLVICDVEMPNMNGFEFLGQRRRDPELMKIPVAMLTSRSSEKHRQLATHLGASAYFTKPYIEQQFLTAIKNILES